MKHIKYFENTNGIKVGDYVYPKPECCGKFTVLKPMRYKIYDIFKRYGKYFCAVEELTNQSIHINEFDLDCFTKETKTQKTERTYNL